MSAVPKTLPSAKDYLDFERKAEFRHEFYKGEIFQMSGASREHNILVTNLVTSANSQLRGKSCETYSNDMRVHVPATGLFTYPDVVIACGAPKFLDDEFDTLLNPIVLIEVLSPTTANYDRGKKFWHYQSIESLREYLLIAQDETRVEHLIKQSDGRWQVAEYASIEKEIELPSIEIVLKLSEIYERILKS
jgi:Uma2 family endonuclease